MFSFNYNNNHIFSIRVVLTERQKIIKTDWKGIDIIPNRDTSSNSEAFKGEDMTDFEISNIQVHKAYHSGQIIPNSLYQLKTTILP